VLSDTRQEWVQAEFGISAAGAIVVPIYPSSPPGECEWVISDSGAGMVDEDGFLTISGRKKDIIITAGGKNITPANIENDLRQSPWISHPVMYGDRRPYPVALISLDAEGILPWAREHGLPTEFGALAAHPEVHRLIQSAIDQANAGYAKVAQIKKFAILDHDLSVEGGELTPTLKVRRQVIANKYADILDKLYTEPVR
jgi:long-chain acyl-CoA synthetase